MLQLSLVCERWPLGDIGRLWSGIAALAVFWTAGTGAYFLLVNLDAVPAAERAAAGLRNLGGPIAGPSFGSALIAVGGLAGGVLHRPARLARQHDHPALPPPARRQRPRARPRRTDLHHAPQPGQPPGFRPPRAVP
jgi:hypothetical protein